MVLPINHCCKMFININSYNILAHSWTQTYFAYLKKYIFKSINSMWTETSHNISKEEDLRLGGFIHRVSGHHSQKDQKTKRHWFDMVWHGLTFVNDSKLSVLLLLLCKKMDGFLILLTFVPGSTLAAVAGNAVGLLSAGKSSMVAPIRLACFRLLFVVFVQCISWAAIGFEQWPLKGTSSAHHGCCLGCCVQTEWQKTYAAEPSVSWPFDGWNFLKLEIIEQLVVDLKHLETTVMITDKSANSTFIREVRKLCLQLQDVPWASPTCQKRVEKSRS